MIDEVKSLSQSGVSRYIERILDTLNDPSLNGWEMEYLDDIIGKFLKQDVSITLSQKQWYHLERILQKRDPIDLF
jgi:hypothetical protein